MNNKIEKFEDILAWQKSQKLAHNIYKLFKTNKDYSFRDQICRASVSVSNNIAEGYERKSTKEFLMFLYIAKASCGEVRSMLYLALDLNYISNKNFNLMHSQTTEISKIIAGFIKYLQKNKLLTS
jgi:four helix bundle protein